MEYIQNTLLLLAALWSLQIVGTYFQLRKYQRTIRDVFSKYESGYLGIGSQRSIVSSGALVVLVLSDDSRIVEFKAMVGRTVFSEFEPYPELVGLSFEQMKNHFDASKKSNANFIKATKMAFKQATGTQQKAHVLSAA